jgi:hypothetical protein
MGRTVNSILGAVAFLAIGIVACNKTEVDTPTNPLKRAKDVAVPPYLFSSDNGGNFVIHTGAGCAYGLVSNLAYAASFNPSDGALIVDSYYSMPPVLLERGATPGNLGPVYWVIAPGSSGLHVLKLQVRNVLGAAPFSYNAQFNYHQSTGTWTWDSSASTYYAFQVLPSSPLCTSPGGPGPEH